MSDPDISKALSTHPPDAEFVNSTRDMLRAAWNEPVGPSTPPGNNRPGGGGIGHISRWMAGGAAAGLIVVGITALVLLRPSTPGDQEAILPTIPQPTSPDSGAVASRDTQPVPATPPPVTATASTNIALPVTTTSVAPATSTTDVPVLPTKPPEQTPAPTSPPTKPPVVETTKPTTTTAAPTTTTKAPTTTSTTTTTKPPTTTTTVPVVKYVPADLPKWALGHISDPVKQFPGDGVYAAYKTRSDGQTAEFALAQIFLAEECVAQFGEKRCRDGVEFEIDPENRWIASTDSTPVVTPFLAANGKLVRYRIPASEFARLLAGEAPSPGAPKGIELAIDVNDFCKFKYSGGAIVEVAYDEQF